jgi:hypothetical protein
MGAWPLTLRYALQDSNLRQAYSKSGSSQKSGLKQGNKNQIKINKFNKILIISSSTDFTTLTGRYRSFGKIMAKYI